MSEPIRIVDAWGRQRVLRERDVVTYGKVVAVGDKRQPEDTRKTYSVTSISGGVVKMRGMVHPRGVRAVDQAQLDGAVLLTRREVETP